MNSVGLRLATSATMSSRSCVLSAWKSTKLPRQQWWTKRYVHSRKELPYKVEEGLGNFLPPNALKVVAEEYQQGLLDRLNDEVRGTAEDKMTVAQIVLSTSQSYEKAMAFNYASLALNNSFFLDNLKPPPPRADNPGELGNHEGHLNGTYLHSAFRSQMGSLEHFKSSFCAAATGMAGTGYVWLVTDRSGSLAYFPTFAAGTLLVRSRRQVYDDKYSVLGEGSPSPTDPQSATLGSTPTSPVSGLARAPPSLNPSSPSRTLHTSPVSRIDTAGAGPSVYSAGTNEPDAPNATFRDIRSLGEVLIPLFCVSVHEHCWMSAGYGVWGKEAWLKEFWSVLDWEKVVKAYTKFVDLNTNSIKRK
ncbi:hypothetical protein SERLA73DRAFT_103425 [Serpula lacrymans var. lacrymans S7.3]|uniref:Manganese/iron superoxide dismutase C-terminal domain-containing protein n=1 Tax=Serpula lacrymans var. lacrymans (strain S7.3) TaxID=936435 RepID=F8PQF0_SERL3|nr:hypothetical protein SERLA73DRAFT_103425 [Serpula lacrymans var. lacrymans S7.3]